MGWAMVFNATFNNISVISWQSVLLVEYPEKTTDLLQVTDIMFFLHYVSYLQQVGGFLWMLYRVHLA
jgi:hypothetical protein